MAAVISVCDTALDKAVFQLMQKGYTQEQALLLLRDVVNGRLAQLISDN